VLLGKDSRTLVVSRTGGEGLGLLGTGRSSREYPLLEDTQHQDVRARSNATPPQRKTTKTLSRTKPAGDVWVPKIVGATARTDPNSE
jgi:hypothetical protein